MNNIKVYIVDDENIVRDGLLEYVPWADYNMDVVGTAENGEIAYKYLLSHEVDLVISDISMPQLDGLEMVEKLKGVGKKPVVILISGYSDFEYAQRAIKTNLVLEYILKPINFEELDKVLAIAKENISKLIKNEFPILENNEWKKIASDEKSGFIAKQLKIIDLIKFCKKEQAQKLFHDTWRYMVENHYSNNMIERYCIECIMGIIELVLEQRNSRDVLLEDPIGYIRSRHSLKDVKLYVNKMIETSCRVMSRRENEKMSSIVHVALDYINENYADHNQSLNLLAEKLQVSSNYLCLKFKEETGINYTKYLNSLRVKHAKQLLKDVTLKVYMVSDRVGFEDTRYFSRIFRLHTGYTPTEYQKKEASRI